MWRLVRDRAGRHLGEDRVGGGVAPVDRDLPGVVVAGIGERAQVEQLGGALARRLVGRRRDAGSDVGDRHLEGGRAAGAGAGVLVHRDGHGEGAVVGVGVHLSAIGPGAPSLKTVLGEPSPQSTVTCPRVVVAGIGERAQVERLRGALVAVWSAGAVTTGATLATVTWKVAEPLTPAPASSSTVTVTV